MTTLAAPPRLASRSTVLAMAAARTLLALLGLLGLASVAFFSFFATPAEGGVDGAGDVLVAAWKALVSLGFLAVALTPRLARSRRARANWLARCARTARTRAWCRAGSRVLRQRSGNGSASTKIAPMNC